MSSVLPFVALVGAAALVLAGGVLPASAVAPEEAVIVSGSPERVQDVAVFKGVMYVSDGFVDSHLRSFNGTSFIRPRTT